MGKTQIDLTGEAAVIEEQEPAIAETDTVIAEDGTADDDVIDEDLDPRDQLPKGAVVNEDGSVTITLSRPVTLKTRKAGKVREKHFETLTLHRMTGADIRAINGVADEHRVVTGLARSTRTNQAVMNGLFDRMIDFDIMQAGQVLNHFLASGRTISTHASA
ncbi:hypothetical protein [Oceaniradius stylonematis]|uniref:hypothetical protein n=1 Tax=Oceaniradius stylonematis TaxID=2184161 RepID=UPI00273F2012|nr:hypothetical protein [Oceaniradius stylonematis]